MTAADLTIYPQTAAFVPGVHLNIRESQHVQRDWEKFAVTTPAVTVGTWTIRIVHADQDTLVSIPRSSTPAAAQRMAVAA